MVSAQHHISLMPVWLMLPITVGIQNMMSIRYGALPLIQTLDGTTVMYQLAPKLVSVKHNPKMLNDFSVCNY